MKDKIINIRYIHIVIILFLFVNSLFSQNYNFKHWESEDNLIDPNIISISKDSSDRLLISTLNGLSIYNGYEFLNLNKFNGLLSNYVNCAIPIKNDKIAVGTDKGLSILDNNGVMNYELSDDSTDNPFIYCLLELNNKLYMGTRSGVKILSSGEIEKFSPDIFHNKLRVYDIKKFADKIYFATREGLFIKDGDKLTKKFSDKIVFKITKSPDGIIYLLTSKGIGFIKDGDFAALDFPDTFPFINSYDFTFTSNKKLWIATTVGLYKYNNGNLLKIDDSSGLNTDVIYSLYYESGRGLWIGTDKGLNLFLGEDFVQYDRTHGVKTIVWSINQDFEGNIIAGTDGEGILIKNKNEFMPSGWNIGGARSVWSIIKTSKGQLAIGTEKGPFLGRPGNFKRLFPTNFDDDPVFKMIEDNDANLWIGTQNNGLFKYDGSNLKRFSTKTGDTRNSVYSLNIDLNGDVLVGTERGIFRIKNDIVTDFAVKELKKYEILDIYQQNSSSYYFATLSNGLLHYSFEGNEWTLKKITKADGLTHNSIMFIQRWENKLMIATINGINFLNLDDYENFGKINIIPLGKYDGIPSIESNGGTNYLDNNGQLWYANINGIVKLNLNRFKLKNNIPRIFLRNVRVNFSDIDISQFGNKSSKIGGVVTDLKLPSEYNYIQFHFGANDYDNPDLIKFSFMLEGYDNEFSPYTFSNEANYPNLPYGKYKFIIRAMGRTGVKSVKNLEYPFEIETPFFSSKLFFGILTIIILILISFFYKINVIDVRKRNIELEELYAERLEFGEKLLQAQKDSERVFQHAHEAIIISDPDTFNIVDVNDTACTFYGYSREEMVGKSLDLVTLDLKTAQINIRKMLKSRSVQGLITTHRKRNGEIVKLEVSATAINYKGKLAVVASHRDVTMEQQVRENLVEAKLSAEKSNKLKTEFLAQMSHEIRSPLNVILNFLSFINEEVDSEDEDVKFAFGSIERASKRIIRTIDLILNVSELQTGTYEPNFEVHDINKDILLGVVTEYNYSARKKNLKIDYQILTENCNVSVDNYTVNQIFSNLVDNAIKYTEKGEIFVRILEQEDYLVVEIEDTGIGIAKEYLPILFSPFSQEEQGYTRKFEGNGLGMALVKGYCKLNNALIDVESKKNVGTKFTVRFPKLT